MVKIVLVVIAALTGGLIGRAVGAKYRRREQLIVDFITLCRVLRREITYSMRPLKEVLTTAMEGLRDDAHQLIESFRSQLERGDIPKIEKTAALQEIAKDAERNQIFALFETLGKSDAETQAHALISIESSLTEILAEATDGRKKYLSVSSKLGVLCGIGLGILVL